MLKIVGCIMVVLTSTAIGYEKSKEISIHRRELEELQRIFMMIQAELEHLKTPFGELFLKIQNRTEGKYKLWMNDIGKELKTYQKGTFEKIWNRSIEVHFKESFLTTSEIEELKQISKNISHMEAIRLYLTQIEISIQYIREEEKTKKKLYQSMGIMVGIFLVIVLV